MTKYGSDQVAFLLVDGYSILGVQTTFRDDKEAITEESHGLGASWVEHEAVGVKRATFEQEGFYDDAEDGAHEALNERQGVSRILCYGVAGNVVGRKMIGFAGAMQVNYQRLAARNELHKANARYLGNGQVDEGVILHEHTAETTANGQGSGVDNTTSTANGAVGYLQVSALTLGGYTSVTVKIQHSSDGNTWADLITFDNVTTAPTAQRKTVAGTINRHLRAIWQFNGAGAGQSIRFVIGASRQ